jgi:hypothetical protein
MISGPLPDGVGLAPGTAELAEPGLLATAEDVRAAGALLVVPAVRVPATRELAASTADPAADGVLKGPGGRERGVLAGGWTARTAAGENDGRLPAPNAQASTLPGAG